MKISVVGDSDTVTGFRLAGVKEAFSVSDANSTRETVRELMAKEDISIIIIAERKAEEIREDLVRLTEGRRFPLIVEIPDKQGRMEGKVDLIKELVRKAVGIDIKVD